MHDNDYIALLVGHTRYRKY